jgi:hypothetical protein
MLVGKAGKTTPCITLNVGRFEVAYIIFNIICYLGMRTLFQHSAA